MVATKRDANVTCCVFEVIPPIALQLNLIQTKKRVPFSLAGFVRSLFSCSPSLSLIYR
jgi:hypothetical protein